MKPKFIHIVLGAILSGFIFSCSATKHTKCNTCPKWSLMEKKVDRV